jgi:hypothetical protein
MSRNGLRRARILLPVALVLAAAIWGCATHGGGKAFNSAMDTGAAAPEMAAGSPAAPPMAGGMSAGRPEAWRASKGYGAASAEDGRQSASGSASGDFKTDGAKTLAGFPDIESWFAPQAYAADNQVSEKYLIRNGTLSVKLDNLDAGQKKAEQIAAQFGGTVTDTNISKDDSGYRSGSITLRIPAEHFMEVWSALQAVGDVTDQQITTQDVGGDYVASVSHLKALAAEQDTLQKMFDEALAVQRSRGLGEAYKVLLDTEERLKAVSEEIQSTEDHVKQLADQITRSTITLNLTENPKLPSAAPPDKFNWGIGATFNSAVRDLMGTARGLAQGLIYFVVTLQWVWWLLVLLAARWAWSYYKRTMAGGKRPAAAKPE